MSREQPAGSLIRGDVSAAGQGEGFCDGHRFPVRAGDVVVFPPQSVHGIDVSEDARMYCLELMQPNDMFAGEGRLAHTSSSPCPAILLLWQHSLGTIHLTAVLPRKNGSLPTQLPVKVTLQHTESRGSMSLPAP